MSFKSLLVQKGQLNIPYIGQFTLKYRSAYIDHVENKIYPPAKVVVFDLDTSLGTENASQEEMDWSTQLQDACAENGIASIDEIGTLKKVNSIWVFNSLENNVGSDYQGLPKIEATPILKEDFVSERVKEVENVEPVLEVSMQEDQIHVEPMPQATVETAKSNTSKKNFALPLIIGAALFFISGLIWVNFNKGDVDNANPVTVSNRNNVKPSEEDAILDNIDAIDEDFNDEKPAVVLDENDREVKNTESVIVDNEDSTIIEEDKNDEAVIEEEADVIEEENVAHTSYGENEAVIIIGAFRSSSNIGSVKKKVNEMGYEMYQDDVKGLKRLGLIYNYDNLNDLTDVIELASETFNSQAWVLKK